MPEDDLKPRILIVDDEHNIADTLAMVFKIKGHESMAAYSAESCRGTGRDSSSPTLCSATW